MKIADNALPALRQGLQLYRLRKCFPAVRFDQTAKGRIVFLPEGTEVCVVGSSRLSKCLEVLCQSQRYSIFETDLLGPWSVLTKSQAEEFGLSEPGQAANRAGTGA